MSNFISNWFKESVKEVKYVKEQKALGNTFSESVALAPNIQQIGGSTLTKSILKDKNILQKTFELAKTYPKTSGVIALTAPTIAVVAKETLSNPKPIVKAYVSQADFAQDLYNLGGNFTMSNAGDFAKEHPFGTTVLGTAAVVGTGYATKNLITGALNFAANQNLKSSIDNLGKSGIDYEDTSKYLNQFKQNIPDIPDIPTIPEDKGEKQTSKDLTPPMPSGTPLPVPEKNLVSYGNKDVSTTRKKKKTKTLYTSPFRVTNRINIFNKNG